jgi:hypothetical protein
MRFFRRETDLGCHSYEEWRDLLMLSQMNMLGLAHSMLAIMYNPEIADESTREQLALMIEGIEYGIARLEEFVVE